MNVPQHIIEHLKDLNSQAEAVGGCKVFLVGGAVRDLMLGKEPKDYDFVTNLAPDLVSKLGFPQVGKSFPVYHTGVGELATTRTERKTGTGYTGFETYYTPSFKEDCLRRDLTVNAMLWHPDMGLVCPIERSAADLHEGKLHACSSAFVEDPLRVLRVARFASRQDKPWMVTTETFKMMEIAAKELHHLPSDRIRMELSRAKSIVKFHYILNLNAVVAKEVQKWFPVYNYRHFDGMDESFNLIEYLSCFDAEVRKSAILRLGFSASHVSAANTYEAIRNGINTPAELVSIWKASRRGLDLPWETICEPLKLMKESMDALDFNGVDPVIIHEKMNECAYYALFNSGFLAKSKKVN